MTTENIQAENRAYDPSKDGLMEVMGRKGDTKTVWDKHNEDEVEQAKKTFKELKAKKFTAFRVDKKGEAGEQMDEFDPTAERIIFVPQMAGG